MVSTKLSQVLLIVPAVVSVVYGQTQYCNNAAALCSKTYDNVTHLGAHDSPFVRNMTNGYSVAGDQIYTTLQQLDSGVRLHSAQVHTVTGSDGQPEWRLCHTLCQLYDAGLLVNWLKDIKGWLDRNPNDVVTLLLVNSDNTNSSTLGDIYQQAGLDTYSYQPSSTTQPSTEWPTLGDMISQNKRLVNFIASLDPSTNQVAPYLLDEFTFVFENNYDVVSPDAFTCEPNRPSSLNGDAAGAISRGYLPLMNHFRYDNLSGIEIPSVENVNQTNAPSGGGPGNLGDAADNCTRIYGRAPTLILTDFTNVGPAIITVDRLNGVEGETSGRLVLPDTIEESMADPSPTVTEAPPSSTSSAPTATSVLSSSSTTSAVESRSTSSSTSVRLNFQPFMSGVPLWLSVCAVGSAAWVLLTA